MRVWRATAEDIPQLVAMGRKFRAASKSPIPFSEESARQFISNLIKSPDGFAMRSKSGMIMGVLSPAYFNTKWVMAVELAWWAEDRSGVTLLCEFEKWANERNADEVRMTTLSSIEGPERILARRGYAPAEISYQKVI